MILTTFFFIPHNLLQSKWMRNWESQYLSRHIWFPYFMFQLYFISILAKDNILQIVDKSYLFQQMLFSEQA